MNYRNYRNCLFDAIDVVLAWELPEEALADAVKAQACLMAGGHPEDIGGLLSD